MKSTTECPTTQAYQTRHQPQQTQPFNIRTNQGGVPIRGLGGEHYRSCGRRCSARLGRGSCRTPSLCTPRCPSPCCASRTPDRQGRKNKKIPKSQRTSRQQGRSAENRIERRKTWPRETDGVRLLRRGRFRRPPAASPPSCRRS